MAAELSYNSAWYNLKGAAASVSTITKSYTPFGEQIGEAVSGFGYNGEYYNAATGSIYLRARNYEPAMNRFSQKDILRGNAIQPSSQNRYLYVQNDPLNFADANGMARTYTKAAPKTYTKAVKTPPVTYTNATRTPTTSTTSSTSAYKNVVLGGSSKPAVYTSARQEYAQYRQTARTPTPQEYQQLQRAGANISYGQYVNQKLNTTPQSYSQFVYNKSIGKPNYTTYGATTVIQQQSAAYYTHSGNYVAANMPSVEYKQAIKLHECTKTDNGSNIPNIGALGAGDNGASALDETWDKIVLLMNREQTNGYDCYAGSYFESGNSYAWSVYARASGPKLDRGLTLGEVGAGLGDVGGEYEYGSWNIETVTADAKAGLSLDYAGFEIGGRLVGAEGGVNVIPLPSDKHIYIGLSGELFALGAKAYYDADAHKITIGLAALIGGSISVGIVD